MEDTLKKLPIGIQTFSAIREDNYVYIDKTPLVHQMVTSAGRFFLSRPRRFGKSLLVDTLKELFEGNKALFKGLYIEDKWDFSKTHPVIHLNFANGVIESRAELDQAIYNLLRENQIRLNIECAEFTVQDPAGCLAQLIQLAAQHYGQKVAVLVDEYDKPILDNIDQPELAATMREGLKNIYSVLKAQDAHLRFVFMTGVTKFSKVSLFSGMNQLEDITLDRRFAAICGYTQHDLETDFAEHLAGVDWAKLKDWYNGYQFLGEPVYNPFDILLFINKNKTYRNYWFETGNPGFLLKLFRKQRYFLPDLSNLEVGEDVLDSFDVEQINPITLLFQAGYLTIAKTSEKRQRLRFHLKVPNFEVQQALADHFASLYSQTQSEQRLHRQDSLFDAFESADFSAIQQQIESLFAAIPWRNFTQNDLPDAEGYYASVLYAWLCSINATIIPEDITHHGQADITIKLGDQIYVTEIKLDKSESFQPQTPNPALAQIQAKHYAQKYLAEQQNGKQIHQLGLVFNKHARNLVQMDWQSF
ncbi:ATP-binding protein [Thiomicrospira sp. ALE5]|uniref:ATP-binding protein n=1 Tax=Thiomicrospira sp. ALE5 TaxID=748650 RepID=UPI0008F1E732|nr:ATP-binding protein [Thiomicrospira sp. ALE5]SFR60709.1 PD-(D/E)XK nuclease superfamily protein [Thiomicrospira sp. ALE5]